MIRLVINGNDAVIAASFSTTLTFENTYFTKTSSYSLDIDLPMPANIHIFGSLNRIDVRNTRKTYTAVLYNNNRIVMNGTAILLAVDDVSVKVQLVSGNAEFNFLSCDRYIDELELGVITFPQASQSGYFRQGSEKGSVFRSVDDGEGVWLPVMYDENKLLNDTAYDFGTEKFEPRPWYRSCSAQPYLLVVIRKIINLLGYTLSKNYIDNTWWRNIYIVNGFQSDRINKALPHWTVAKFFDEIEKLFGVIVYVNENTKEIEILDINSFFSEEKYIIDNVVEEFKVDTDEDVDDKDISTGNTGYKLPSETDDGYERIGRDIIREAKMTECSSFDDVESSWNSQNESDKKNSIYKAGNRYYINYKAEDGKNTLREVNWYADIIRNQDQDSLDSELEIVPAKIIKYDIGVYDSIAAYQLGKKSTSLWLNVAKASFYNEMTKTEKICVQDVIDGNQELKADEKKKDILEIAISTGKLYSIGVTYKNQTYSYHYPLTFTDYTQVVNGLEEQLENYSLSLNDVCENSLGYRHNSLSRINSDVVYEIDFLSDIIPPLNRTFIIRNQKYLAKKLESSLVNGEISRLVKGTFYKIS